MRSTASAKVRSRTRSTRYATRIYLYYRSRRPTSRAGRARSRRHRGLRVARCRPATTRSQSWPCCGPAPGGPDRRAGKTLFHTTSFLPVRLRSTALTLKIAPCISTPVPSRATVCGAGCEYHAMRVHDSHNTGSPDRPCHQLSNRRCHGDWEIVLCFAVLEH